MKHIRTIAIATALTFALPAIALAAERDTPAESKGDRGKGDKGKRGERPKFPMKAETFMAHVDKRIAHMKSKVDARLERSNLDDAKKAEIRAKVNAASNEVRAAAKEATADGTVTKEEAMKVREVARSMREKARGEAKGKGKGKAKGEGKGKGKAKGRS